MHSQRQKRQIDALDELNVELVEMHTRLAQEVMDHQTAREQVVQISKLNSSILDSAAEGIIGLDAKGETVFANRAAQKLLGYTQEEMLQRDLHALIHHTRTDGSSYPATECPSLQTLAGKKPTVSANEVYWCKDGSSFPVEFSSAPIHAEDGQKIVGVVISFRDITQQQELQNTLAKQLQQQICLNQRLEESHKQLLQSEKMASVGQLAAGVAHEINNPAGFVNSNLGSLNDYVPKLLRLIETYEQTTGRSQMSDADRTAIEQVATEIELHYLRDDITALLSETQSGMQRITSIVRDLKQFSHPDHGEWLSSNLHTLIDSTLNVVWNELKYTTEVIKDYGELPPVTCLPSQINQVIANLLLNAAQAIEDRGSITILTGVDGETVVIEISDTGAGIAEADQRRIFEPFFTTKAVGTGTGLGLSISYQIIENHRGTLTFYSVPGEGTTFRIQLPIERAQAIKREDAITI